MTATVKRVARRLIRIFTLEKSSIKNTSAPEPTKYSTLSNKKKKLLAERKGALRTFKKRKPKLIYPVPNPRYDEIYDEGVKWLDSLAGPEFSEETPAQSLPPAGTGAGIQRVDREQSRGHTGYAPAVIPAQAGIQKKKKLLAERKGALRTFKKRKPKLIYPVANPRYDEIYDEGVKWLDSLAGPEFSEGTITVHFSEEVWDSVTRKDDDLS